MADGKWSVKVAPLELALAERFTIASRSWDTTTNVFVEVSYDGTAGIGEVSPSDDVEGVVATVEGISLEGLGGPFDLEGVLELLPAGEARCALDIALHDVAAQRAGISVAELVGLGGRALPPTSVTVPIAAVDRMVERAGRLVDHPVIKMKVGFTGDVEAVAAVRSVFGNALRIDANEGWAPEEAIDRLAALARFDIELCEQPIPAGDRDALAAVTHASDIPIFADEDVRTAADVAALAGAVDGVNLKLRKTGGIREFLRAVAAARAHGLSVMVGCDLESGVAATAQASVAALCDYADIDGPLLLASDPHPGVAYDRGTVMLPEGPGLGVTR